MRPVRLLAAAAALLSAATVPAHADTCETSGYYSSDLGTASVTCGTLRATCELNVVHAGTGVVLVVDGQAVAAPKGTIRSVATGVRCVVRNSATGGVAVDQESASEGAVAVIAPPVVVPTSAAAYEVCVAAFALWADNSITDSGTPVCVTPS